MPIPPSVVVSGRTRTRTYDGLEFDLELVHEPCLRRAVPAARPAARGTRVSGERRLNDNVLMTTSKFERYSQVA